jgi:Protein of unknown function (DUF2752)
METRSLRGRALDFCMQCLSLSSPMARLVVFGIGIAALTFVDVRALGLPNLCIWERLFGYCPVNGVTRGLSAFFHGEWESALRYNVSIAVLIPIIIGIVVADVWRVANTVFRMEPGSALLSPLRGCWKRFTSR